MTTAVLDSSTTGKLAAALSSFNYSVIPADAAAAIGRIMGPVLVTEASRAGQQRPETIIALTDRVGSDTDAALATLSQSLCTAVEPAVGPLEMSPVTPHGELGSVVAAYPSIAEALLIMDGANAIGVVLWIPDRRQSTPAVPDAAPLALAATPSENLGPMAMLRDVTLAVSVELGRTELSLSDVLGMHIGSVVELDRAAGSPADIRVNGTLLARGEVVVIEGNYAIRIIELIESGSARS